MSEGTGRENPRLPGHRSTTAKEQQFGERLSKREGAKT